MRNMTSQLSKLKRRIDAVPPEPWKNQGGTTRQLGSAPGWRISLAEVTENAEFSVFQAYTRHSVVVEGQGLELHSPSSRLQIRQMEPVTYAGDHLWSALLFGGSVRILNVMVQTGVWQADLAVGDLFRFSPGIGISFVLPINRSCICEQPSEQPFEIQVGEYLLWDDTTSAVVRISSKFTHDRESAKNGHGGLLVGRIRPAGHHDTLC